MSLQFILGSAGSGKSHHIFEEVTAEAAAYPDRKYLVIVPEQFTMATQKELVRRSPKHGIMNIDVLSFDRLAYRVFDELGTPLLDVLEDTGKNLLLRKVAQEKADQLTVLKGNMTRPGYIDEVKSLLTELTQYNIDAEDFEEMAQTKGMSKGYYAKAHDILVMYQGFQEAIAGRYITAEEVLEKLSEVIDQSEFVKDAVIVLDGYTGFTPIQNKVVSHLLKLAHRVCVTVTIDQREEIFSCYQEQNVFAMSLKMISSLIQLSRNAGVEVEDPVRLDNQPGRFMEGGMLAHLERNLFRPTYEKYKKLADGQADTKEQSGAEEHLPEGDSIEIYRLANPLEELDYAAGSIRELVRTQGYRYRDMAIVCANLEDYQEYVQETFDRYHVPVYLDTKTDIIFHPLTEHMSSAFSMLTDNFSEETVLHHLKCGLSDLTFEEVDALDNYIHAFGIRGAKKYQKIFTRVGKGFTPEEVALVNQAREKMMIAWSPLVDAIGKGQHTVRDISIALYQFLQATGVEDKLRQRAAAYEEAGDEIKAEANRRIYGIVMDLLDKMVSLLGDESMTAQEYDELLEAGFRAAEIGTIPSSADAVVVGDMERTRLDHIKVLYLIGASDASIPKAQGNGGILSQLERQQLQKADYELAPTDRQRTFMQRFYIYLALTKPSQKLIITYARLDHAGKALRQSYLIGTILQMFPGLSVENLEHKYPMSHVVTRESARLFLLQTLRDFVAGDIHLGEDDPALQETVAALLAWYDHDHESRQILSYMMDQVFYQHRQEVISAAVMKAVAGDTVQGSVSRLEQYAACAYAYFLSYGLRLTERQEHELGQLDMGTLYHAALENYALLMGSHQLTWHEITPEQSKEILEEAIRNAYADIYNTDILEDARQTFILERMKKTLYRTVWALTKQVRSGKFEPAGFEVDFKSIEGIEALEFELKDKEKLRLRGKIDRIDTYEEGKDLYVKIIDYKSGSTKLDLPKMYYGLQIQLILYMSAALEGLQKTNPGKDVHPAGMLYYHLDDPFSEIDSDDREEIDKDLLMQLRPDGLVADASNVLEALDESLGPDGEGNYSATKSRVVPVRTTKTGKPYSDASTASDDDFAVMGKYVKTKITSMAEQISDGDIKVYPYRMGNNTACEYCPYHSICGFDVRMNGYDYNKLPKLDKKEVIEKMREDLTDER